MGLWPGPEGLPADSASLQSSVVRERLDGLYYADLKVCRVEAESPNPSMRVYAHSALGKLMGSDGQQSWWAGGLTGYMSAPSGGGNIRYDLIWLSPNGVTASLGITTGVEGAPGVAGIPIIPDDVIPLAYIYHRYGETSIKNTDDSVNGYIALRCQPFLSGKTGPTVKLKDAASQNISGAGVHYVTGATMTIPGGTLGTNNWYDFYTELTNFNLTELCTFRAAYDGTVFAALAVSAVGLCGGVTGGSALLWTRLRGNYWTNQQRGSMVMFASSNILAVGTAAVNTFGVGTASVDSTLDKDFSLTIELSANDSLVVIAKHGVKFL